MGAVMKIRFWKRCKHERVRCVHGDEIIQVDFARVKCLDCGRALKHHPLPEPCTVTGHRHHRAIHLEGDK
jgi:hypothetical protein